MNPVGLILSIIGSCLGVIVIVALAVIGALVHFPVSRTEAYNQSIRIVQSSEGAGRLLGSNIHTASIVWGSVRGSGDAKFAEWSVKVSGSHGTGHLYGTANFVRGSWEYSRLELVSADGVQRADLTPAPAQLTLTPASPKRVYLLPIGPSVGESLDWVPAYYKAKLGIDVTVLSRVPLDPRITDPQFQKVDAESCIDFFEKVHPELVRDPRALIIGTVANDIVIPGWFYDHTQNYRSDGRFGIVSIGRIRPEGPLGRLNPEWLNSRVQKLITKNLIVLYYGYPLSADMTSALSGGVPSGADLDEMSAQIVGVDGKWDPFTGGEQAGVSIFDVPNTPTLWQMGYESRPVADPRAQFFVADVSSGLFIQHKTDFVFDGDYPLQFERVYTSMDQYSRQFGIGATSSLEMHLVGQMGNYVDLIMADGSRAHFERDTASPHTFETYLDRNDAGKYWHATAEYMGPQWRVRLRNGWTYFFPYHREWGGNRMTMLGSYSDPDGHTYEMKRDDATGDLTEIVTPSENWLHFENDSQHRITRITCSNGRTVDYEYDSRGRLTRVKASDGAMDTYTYDDRDQMLTAGHGDGSTVLKIQYFADNYVKSETLADGRSFSYTYFRGPQNIIQESGVTVPNGLMISFLYDENGYRESLPTIPPDSPLRSAPPRQNFAEQKP
jgi:YD repeat-containing protein